MPITQEMLPALLGANSRESSEAFSQGMESARQKKLLQSQSEAQAREDALKRYLQGQKEGTVDANGAYSPGTQQLGQAAEQQRNSALAQQLFSKNQGQGGGSVNVNGNGVQIAAKEFNPYQAAMADTKERVKEMTALRAGMKQSLGSSEDAMKAIGTADAFLQNPNSKNLSDVKAMSVQLQGLPARAFGAESKAAGFNPSGWSNVFSKLNAWTGDANQNPLTADDLATFRNNYAVMRDTAVKKFQAEKKDFWETHAPNIAPTLMGDGTLDKIQQGYEQKIQSAYGGAQQPPPWQQPNNPGQPAPPTQPTNSPNKSILQRMVEKGQSGLHNLFGQQQASPQQAQPQAPQQPPMDPMQSLFDAEDKRRAALKVQSAAQPPQQPGQIPQQPQQAGQ